MELQQWLSLIGVPVIVLGFAWRMNPLFVVILAGLSTGLACGISFGDLLALFGDKFIQSRQLASIMLLLPIIGLLEYYGLKDSAKRWISGIRQASSGRILMLYFVLREGAAALGLTSIAGHAQTVRPILVPMTEAAAQKSYGDLPEAVQQKIAAHAAACDNIALFFGEDIFIAFGAVLLMTSFLHEHGYTQVEPLAIGLWGIPTAIAALIIHLFRLARLDAQLAREVATHRAQTPLGEGA